MKYQNNKDDNIHKSEAYQETNIDKKMYFKLHTYQMLNSAIWYILRLFYRNASLIKQCLLVLRIIIKKIRKVPTDIRLMIYRVSTLFQFNLTVLGIGFKFVALLWCRCRALIKPKENEFKLNVRDRNYKNATHLKICYKKHIF